MFRLLGRPQCAQRLCSRVWAAVILLLTSVGAPAAIVLDQSQDAADHNLFIGALDQRIAQTFTPGIDGDLEQVRLRIGYLPSTGGSDASSLLLQVMSTTGGAPSGNVLASASLPHTAFPIAGGLLNSDYTAFDFGGVPLHRGTVYALALRVAVPGDTCARETGSCSQPAYRANYLLNSDAYARGRLFSASAAVPNFALSGDLSFKTFMNVAATAVPEPGIGLALLAGLGFVAAARLRRFGRLDL